MIRLVRAVTRDDGAVDLAATRGLMLAHVPVGRCSCGGAAYGDDLRPARTGRRWWLTMVCDRCRGESSAPLPAPAA